MTIELYASPNTSGQDESPESPVSNPIGELPDDEPSLDLGDLLGSFDSREEAISFIRQQLEERNQVMTDSQVSPFNDYTHVEWLTVSISDGDQQVEDQHYYLVMDEGY